MLMTKMRRNMKPVIIIVAIAFAVGLLYLGLPGGGFFSGTAKANVVATVNGEPIYQSTFRNTLIQYVTQLEAQNGTLPSGQIELISAQLLNQMIDEKIILQAAKEAGIKVNDEELEKVVADFKEQIGGEEHFDQLLKSQNVSLDEFNRRVTEQIMIQKMLEKVAGEGTVSDDEIAKAYEEVHAKHILIRTSEEAGDEEAKAKIEEIRAELANGASFSELAKKYSEDPGSKDNGGDLGFISRGQTVPEFERAAFALAEGEVSEPVKTQFGYHLIKVVERKEAKGEEFEKAKPELEEQLRKAKQNKLLTEWFRKQKEQAEVVINDVKLSAYTAKLQGDVDKAVELFEEATGLEPENGYLYANLGELYERKGDTDKALKNYKKAAELVKTDASLYFVLGTLYQNKDQKEEAIAAYQKASELDPNNFYLHYSLYGTFKQLGAEDLAEKEQKILEEMQKQAEEAQKQAEEQAEKAEPESQEATQSAE
ncbi:MAG: peptidylprolyl isomerase [Firmicutes bacterium]|nr:peptidylprolyl isomerase [Bacillota bacterium]